MNLTPEAILFIIGGLVTGLWALLMWRLQSMETARKEIREGMMKFYGTFEEHVKDDRSHFDSLKEAINTNHVEILRTLNRSS